MATASLKIQDFSHKIALGTVQFGLNYGISNSSGQVPFSAAESIVEFAGGRGITTLDTAPLYGESEEVVGRILAKSARDFEIITKMPPLADCPDQMSVEGYIEKNLGDSLARLGRTKVAGYLLHRENDLLGEKGAAVWAFLTRKKQEGILGKIGVSCYTPGALEILLDRYPLEIVQVPFNLLDRRFFTPGLRDRLERRQVEVHVRSVFLQGLFFLDEGNLPANMKFAQKTLEELRKVTGVSGTALGALALGFALAQPFISKAVIGVTSATELQELISGRFSMPDSETDRILRGLADLTNGKVIDPRQWA